MTIVAAVDRSDRAGQIVAEAAELAAAFGDELHVVHVLNQSEFVELERTSVEESGQAIDMDRIRDIAREIATEAAESVTDDFTAVGLVGDASDEIVRYSDDQDARYIVISGRKRSPVGKALFGSVTQSVLLDADRPVVTALRDADEEE
ncbi:MAG: universal stress protein [Haloferacaceae archaeon]